MIKRYHAPSTPYERALVHPEVPAAVKQRLREQYRTLNPVALLAEESAQPKRNLAIGSITMPAKTPALTGAIST